MRRSIVTSGGYGNPPSKFKPLNKTLPTIHYIDVGGELIVSSKRAILREKDLLTGEFTGKDYKIHLKSLKSKLSRKYKDIPRLAIVCTLTICQQEITIRHQNTVTSEPKYIYRLAHIHHILHDKKLTVRNRDSSGEPEPLILEDEEAKPAYLVNVEEYPKNFEELTFFQNSIDTVFRYVGNKEEAERQIADAIQNMLGGVRELFTSDGERIDLLVENLLIEIKAASNWDDAIGQILKYKIHFPKHKPVIFLFDDGLGVENAKSRATQIIENFLAVNVHIATSIKDLQSLLC